MKISTTIITTWILFFSFHLKAADFTFISTANNWDVVSVWSITAGTDADGIPDADDNVTIPAGRTCTLIIPAACRNLELIASSTVCLILNGNSLTINGTLSGGGTSANGGGVSPIVSRSVGVGARSNVIFNDGSMSSTPRTIISNTWDAYPLAANTLGFDVEIRGSGSAASNTLSNLLINAPFICTDMSITSCKVTTNSPLYFGHGNTASNSSNGTGRFTVAVNAIFVTNSNVGRRSPTTTTNYCQSMLLSGTVEITANINFSAYFMTIPGKLKFSGSNTTGIVNDAARLVDWGVNSALEYANINPTTTGDEISPSGTLPTTSTAPFISTIIINFPSTSNSLTFNRYCRVDKELAFLGGLAYVNNVLRLGTAAEVTGYGSANVLRFLNSPSATASFEKVASVGTTFFPIGTNSLYTPIEVNLSTVALLGFEIIAVKVATARPSCVSTTNETKSFRSYYQVTTQVTGTDGTISLHYPQTSAGIALRGSQYLTTGAKVLRCNGTTRTVMSATAGEITDNANFTYRVDGSFFGGSTNNYIITSDAALLPITLRDFTAKLQGEMAQLVWNTEGALNFSHFEIEHSADGLTWSKEGTVDYITTINKYDFKHYGLLNGTNYYRLKQVDKDGEFEYSRVVSLKSEANNMRLNVAPTVAENEVSVYLNNLKPGIISLNLMNSVGVLVATKQVKTDNGNQIIPFDLSTLPVGMYVLSAFENNTFIKNVKLIKSR